MGKKLEELDLTPVLKKLVTPDFLQKLGELVVSELKKNTRLGYGVAGQGENQQKLAPLATATVAKRRYEKKQGRLSNDTSPAKSNLTQSGQLLDSIQFRIIGDSLEVFLNGERNQTIAGYVSEARPFFNLSKTMVRVLSQFIEKELNNKLRNIP